MLCFCLRNKTCLLHPYMYPVTTTSCVYKPINANALIKKSSSFYILKFDRQETYTVISLIFASTNFRGFNEN